jgi:hypothetical protein
MKISKHSRTSLRIATTAALILSCFNFSAQAHQDNGFRFSNNGQQINVSGVGENRRYQVDNKTFYWYQLNAAQQARLGAIEDEIKEAQQAVDLDSAELDRWAEEMDQVAIRIDLEAEDLEALEIELESELERINFKDLERLSARLEKHAAKLEKRMAKHEEEMHILESRAPKINQAALRQFESEVRKMEQVLREIADEI